MMHLFEKMKSYQTERAWNRQILESVCLMKDEDFDRLKFVQLLEELNLAYARRDEARERRLRNARLQQR